MTQTILEIFFSVGARTRPGGWMGRCIGLYAAGVAIWVYYAVTIALIDRLALTAIFISLIFALLFLIIAPTAKSKSGKPGPLDLSLIHI